MQLWKTSFILTKLVTCVNLHCCKTPQQLQCVSKKPDRYN